MASPPSNTNILPYPHFFKVIVHSTDEQRKLSIPKKFVADYGKFLSSSICLKLPDGLEWNVELTKATDNTVWLENGWHQFSEHYRLTFGSFLVFRLDGNSTFHTIILDTTGSEIAYGRNPNFNDAQALLDFENKDNFEPNASVPRALKKMKKECLLSPKIEESEEEEREPKERASRKRSRPFPSSPSKKVDDSAEEEFNNVKKSEKTGFKVVMRQSFVEGRYNMTIPKEFAKKYFLEEEFGAIIIQNSEGRSWPMVYKWGQSHNVGYAYISSGWKCFAQENHLKEGDIGFFQMIKKDVFLFTFEGNCHPPIPPNRNVAKANHTTKNPSFNVKIRNKSHKSFVLNIPLTFADNHLSPTTNTAKLVVGSKQWKVGIKQYEKCFRLSSGWGTFFWQNSLKDGDNCLFKLVMKSEFQCVFEVTIFKKL